MKDENKEKAQEGKQESKKAETKISDLFKKVAALGIGAAFMTEDAVKNMVQDLPLPKDIINGLLEQARSQKNEFIASAKSEFKNYLSNINPTREIDKILSKYEINVDAKLSFQRKQPSDDKAASKRGKQ